MKDGFFRSKLVIVVGMALLAASLTYLSLEEKTEIKHITKEIKLISNVDAR